MITGTFIAKEGEKGITLTSAAQIAALATSAAENAKQALANVSFVNTTMNVVGSNGKDLMVKSGFDESVVVNFSSLLNQIGQLNGLIAWLADARNYYEAETSKLKRIDINTWAEQNDIKIPERPELDPVTDSTMQDVIDSMSIKDRAEFLALNSKAAVFGRFIHPVDKTSRFISDASEFNLTKTVDSDRVRNNMDSARKELLKIVNAPYSKEGDGRDTIVYHHTPSVKVEFIEKTFVQLQHEYRKIEQSLNHMKSDLRKELERRHAEENTKRSEAAQKYQAEYADYKVAYEKVLVQYNQWREATIAEFNKTKIVIPEKYQELVDQLNNLSK
jgi:hypothetical protein